MNIFSLLPGIRRLQSILLKAALIFGAKLYTGVTFEDVIEPNSVEDGWKCKVSPNTHPVSTYEFDVLIGADGKKNVIPGFQQIEMRGNEINIVSGFVQLLKGVSLGCSWYLVRGIRFTFWLRCAGELTKLSETVVYRDL